MTLEKDRIAINQFAWAKLSVLQILHSGIYHLALLEPRCPFRIKSVSDQGKRHTSAEGNGSRRSASLSSYLTLQTHRNQYHLTFCAELRNDPPATFRNRKSFKARWQRRDRLQNSNHFKLPQIVWAVHKFSKEHASCQITSKCGQSTLFSVLTLLCHTILPNINKSES